MALLFHFFKSYYLAFKYNSGTIKAYKLARKKSPKRQIFTVFLGFLKFIFMFSKSILATYKITLQFHCHDNFNKER